MNIKALVHQLHQALDTNFNVKLPRSHLYEGLAAAFGHTTYASLCTDSMFDEGHSKAPIDAAAIKSRLTGLGADPGAASIAAEQLGALAASTGLRVVHLRDFIRRLMGGAQAGPSWADEDLRLEDLSEMLREGLISAAERGHGIAAYALARLLSSAMDDDEEPRSSYWYQQMKAGQALKPHEQACATEYAEWLEVRSRYERYLTMAAKGRVADACIDAALLFDDPEWLAECDPELLLAPMTALEALDHHGRHDLASKACRRAALGGDPEAIELMIAEYDAGSAVRAWGWIYFAEARHIQLEGLEPRAYAVHENGSIYDDDIGGPMYAVEDEGLRPDPLEPSEDAQAREFAARLVEEAPNLREYGRT
ncbi:hypothetical protein [Silanimonas sp.]|uniref:hypothetical protein n=1 Tax=Silanimonas sp. TaxID=1929290 RepID=UPI0022CA3A22|nr:hypothetical protein [Silanimonas sp.]MCZ8064169.1 hypothetical protein [Silanimonas sp.]